MSFKTLRSDCELLIVHSSDLHIEHDYRGSPQDGDPAACLKAVLSTAQQHGADVVLLAGDTFDSHRIPADLLDHIGSIIVGAGLPLVLLPGNHDPVITGSVYFFPALADCANLHVIGVTHEERVLFADLDLEIWGRPHRDYADMIPLERPRPRSTAWQIAVTHGHYAPTPDRTTRLRPSWLIGDGELAATGADYIALGHWNRPARVGPAAYYSGSPEYAGTVNLVRLCASGKIEVTRADLGLPASRRQSDY